MIRTRLGAAEPAAAPAWKSPSRAFAESMLVEILNPKVAVFFLAFLPQFITPNASGQAVAFLALGAWFNLGGTVVNVVVALLASGLRQRLATRHSTGPLGTWMQRTAGALFVALGVKLALSSRG